MNMNLYQVELPLTYPFTIARSTQTSQTSLYLELEHDGVSGLGEVTENDYYGHTFDSIIKSLEKTRPYLERYVNGNPLELWDEMNLAIEGDMFALSALDIAAHDFRGKRLGLPTWQIWGLEWSTAVDTAVPSSYTLGLDSIDRMVEKLQAQAGWSVYKIKMGTDHDLEIVKQLRKHTDAVFRVDANCSWSVEQAIEYSAALADLGVQFIEQPLPVGALPSDKRKLYARSALPIIADEDCQIASDVQGCHGKYHGVNIKICKCGGLSPALKMLRDARRLGMKTMVGCMVESSIGISGAAQLLPLLDFADLDGANLLCDQPASGVQITQGMIARPETPGCGASLNRARLQEFALNH